VADYFYPIVTKILIFLDTFSQKTPTSNVM